MRIIGYVAAWLAAAALASGLAFVALSTADRQVGDVPLTPLLATTFPSGPADVSTSISTSPASQPDPSPAPGASSSTTSTSTTVATSTPATTAVVSTDGWTTLTVPTSGGVVVVAHRPDEVRLESASPAPGYSMEIDKSGPDEVRVEFEGADDSHEVRVRWRGGRLETDVDHDK